MKKSLHFGFVRNFFSFIAIMMAVLVSVSCATSINTAISQRGNNGAYNHNAYDYNANRLTGVNWFGFETAAFVPHGLWARDYKSMIKQIKDLGFNCIRIPWCDAMLTENPDYTKIQINMWGKDPYTGETNMNTDLAGLTALQVMDKIINQANTLGLKIILDNHSHNPDGYREETLWYTTNCSENQWISNWITVVNRYKTNPAVIAVDIKNEPHGGLMGQGMKPPASWGYDVPGYGVTDWYKAAEKCSKAILDINPNLLIIIQGVQEYNNTSNYWWGGNHMGVLSKPITNVPKSQLLYSVHEYGPEVNPQPWFDDPTFPDNMPGVWDAYFGFIIKQNIAAIYFGEFGIKEESATNTSSIAYKWFTKFLTTYGRKTSWTYWSWNPNSGDTGGILKDDWLTVNTAKYNLIKPYLAAAAGGGSSASSAMSSSASSKNSASTSTSSTPSSASSSSASSQPNFSSSASASSASSSSQVYTPKTAPFVFDGAGEYWWRMTSIPSFVNSWNLTVLDINGMNCLNMYLGSSSLPAKQNGYYNIHYKSAFSYGHFEAK